MNTHYIANTKTDMVAAATKLFVLELARQPVNSLLLALVPRVRGRKAVIALGGGAHMEYQVGSRHCKVDRGN